jgi:hypothetical protein
MIHEEVDGLRDSTLTRKGANRQSLQLRSKISAKRRLAIVAREQGGAMPCKDVADCWPDGDLGYTPPGRLF